MYVQYIHTRLKARWVAASQLEQVLSILLGLASTPGRPDTGEIHGMDIASWLSEWCEE